MTASLSGEVDVWGAEAAVDKVWVKGLPQADADAVSAHLMGYPGVVGVEKGEARLTKSFLLLGADPEYLRGYGPLADDPDLVSRLHDERTIVLSRRLARLSPDYVVGGHVPIERADGTVDRFEILAISDAYGHWPNPDERLYGVVADTWLEKDHCVDTQTVRSLAVRFEPGTPDAATIVETAVRELYPGTEALVLVTGDTVVAFHRHDIERDFRLFDILLFLTVLLAGLGLANGQLLAALERAKEIGVLKALGTTRRQVAGVVLLEGAVVGVVGGGLGAALGAGLTPVVVAALQSIAGLDLPVRTPWAWLALGPAIAVGVALLAGLHPIRRMNRTDAVAAVRTG
jgi:putative ABC transport system permease protein